MTRATLTRGQIVDAALEIIADVGVEKLSMRQLSASLGASLGATYRHVPTKEALLALCGRELFDRSYRPRADDEDPLQWIRDEIINLYELIREHPGMAGYVIGHANLVTPELTAAVQESLVTAGLTPESAETARSVLAFYTSGVLLSNWSVVLSANGLPDSKAMLAAGVDFILRGGEPVAASQGRAKRIVKRRQK
jgi:AcrR family transcriptional regulator